uniref:Signal peptide protein n=1 Tax=Heterorhabditis bacteriophora TaxID=37862 RepID=A0A1I7WBL7_HETBA
MISKHQSSLVVVSQKHIDFFWWLILFELFCEFVFIIKWRLMVFHKLQTQHYKNAKEWEFIYLLNNCTKSRLAEAITALNITLSAVSLAISERVKQLCERFKLSTVDTDDLKCLIFLISVKMRCHGIFYVVKLLEAKLLKIAITNQLKLLDSLINCCRLIKINYNPYQIRQLYPQCFPCQTMRSIHSSTYYREEIRSSRSSRNHKQCIVLKMGRPCSRHHYLLPLLDDIFTTLNRGKISQIDLRITRFKVKLSKNKLDCRIFHTKYCWKPFRFRLIIKVWQVLNYYIFINTSSRLTACFEAGRPCLESVSSGVG